VSGDSDVSRFPGKRNARDMSDSQPQDLRTGAWQNCDGHSEPRDIQAAENVTLTDWWCGWGLRVLFFGLDFVSKHRFAENW